MENFTWKKIKKPFFVLAPMANVNNLPFMLLCKQMGADLVYSSMISSNAVVYNPEQTLEIVRFVPEEQPVIIQIFGYDAQIMTRAAREVSKKLKPAGIDLNLGCPAPKIVGNECGSALLRDLTKTLQLVKSIREGFEGQLSVKLRLGIKEFEVKEFCKELEAIGIDALTVHGRTAKQGYTGKANWDYIYEIADQLTIPVIGNGDISSWSQAYEKVEKGNLSGVMIGRASLGNPWIFKSIKDKASYSIEKDELIRVIRMHSALYAELVGEKKASREMRKHLAWYIKGFESASELRHMAVRVENLRDIEEIIGNINSLENFAIMR
jgi:tRNA-dihydrouridine synthase B